MKVFSCDQPAALRIVMMSIPRNSAAVVDAERHECAVNFPVFMPAPPRVSLIHLEIVAVDVAWYGCIVVPKNPKSEQTLGLYVRYNFV